MCTQNINLRSLCSTFTTTQCSAQIVEHLQCANLYVTIKRLIFLFSRVALSVCALMLPETVIYCQLFQLALLILIFFFLFLHM